MAQTTRADPGSGAIGESAAESSRRRLLEAARQCFAQSGYRGTTTKEIAAAAAYFSALKPRRHTRVVESDTVPKTFIIANHYASLPSGGKEAIGKRIIEVPEVLDQFVQIACSNENRKLRAHPQMKSV